MKTTLNVILTVVLFCSAAFAGDQGNGGRPEVAPGIGIGTGTIGTIESDAIIAVIEQYLGLSL